MKKNPGPNLCGLKTIFLLFVFLIGMGIQIANAQDRQITGTVTSSEDGRTLPGTTVLQKGTNKGTVTDLDGNFSITVPEGATLVFSFVGMSTQEVPVGTSNVIDVVLEPDYARLDEVVVIGYGSVRKAELTSSVSSVKSDDFVKGSVRDAGQLLQGKVAGLAVSSPSGNPADEVQILLRGNTSIYNRDQSPLIIIDGVPGGRLSSIAPEDIESFDVLKDGSAAAIYGTRGTNGVILVTTKRAQERGPLLVEYNGYVSTQTILKQMDFLDAEDYRRLIREGNATLQDIGYSTDFLDEITQTPVSHMHNLTFSGGSENTSIITNINYNYQEGIFQRSDIERLKTRLDVTHRMLDGKITANAAIYGDIVSYFAGGDGYSFNNLIYRQALIRNPTEPIKNADGTWYENVGKFQYQNPVTMLEETDGKNKERELRLVGSLVYEPIEGLRGKILASTTLWDQFRGYSESKQHISNTRDGMNGYASVGTTSRNTNLFDLTVDYTKILGSHRVVLLGGYSYQDFFNEGFWQNNYDFPTDAYSYHNISQGNALQEGLAEMDSYKNSSKLIGFFARVNYGFNDKYLLMASVRREGSSKFGENYQWGTFPAVSVGWRISNESFMQNVSLLDDLKLRFGYGVTGTEPSSSYLSLTRLTYSSRMYYNGEWVQTLVPASNPNPDLRWEKKEEINIGLDVAILNNRISSSIDVYRRRTVDLLWNYNVPVPPNLYSNILANVGQIDNTGLEALLQIVPVRTSNLEWISGITYSTNTNELVSLTNELYETTTDYFNVGGTGDPIQTYTHRVQVGEPIGNFYGYKSLDVDDNGLWILEAEDGTPLADYFARTEDDKHVLGNGLPKHYLNFNNTVRYKNFDLTVSMRGAFGFQILNFQRMFYENPTITYNMLETAFDPVYGKQILDASQEYTSYYIEDGDYWKIQNVVLGYNHQFKQNSFIKQARIYASGLNMFTFTGYKGIDPEVSILGLSPGNDNRDKYPTTRVWTFGINLNF